jgi:predicted kinase
MTKFILLVGLPGSGKSYFGNNSGHPFLDDVTQTGELYRVVPTRLLSSGTIVLSDYGFIFPDVRHNAVAYLKGVNYECQIQWLVWENDPEQCWRNIETRNDGRVINRDALFEASTRYIYPCGPNFPVYKPKD